MWVSRALAERVIDAEAVQRENQVVQNGDDADAIPMNALVCAQCGTVAEPGAEGWNGYLDDDDAVVLFCPDCAGQEFEAS